MFLLTCRNRPRNQSKKLLNRLPFEQPITVGRISVHRDLAIGCPGSDRSRPVPEDLACFREFREFTEFGHNPPPDRLEFDLERKFIKHYSKITALQTPQIVRFVTFTGHFYP
jgi:hypothetical protein